MYYNCNRVATSVGWFSVTPCVQQSNTMRTNGAATKGTITSNSAKATLLNNFFYECFNHALPPLRDPLPRCNPDACPAVLLCTVEEIEELLCTLNVDKSTGPNSISPRMLKSTAYSIAPSLTKLFNRSIASGCYQPGNLQRYSSNP